MTTLKLKSGAEIVLPKTGVYIYSQVIRYLHPYQGPSGRDADSIFLVKETFDKHYTGYAFRYYDPEYRKTCWAYYDHNTAYKRGNIVAYVDKFKQKDVIMLKVHEQLTVRGQQAPAV